MAGRHHRLDVAADVEVADDLDEPRVEQGHEVIEDSIDGRLVKDLPVAELVDVQLQRLELDQLLVGDISDANGGEIGEAGIGRQARELGDREGDVVVPLRDVIGDRLEGRLGDHLRPVFHALMLAGEPAVARKGWTSLYTRRWRTRATPRPSWMAY